MAQTETPELQAARRAREEQAARVAAGALREPVPVAVKDPLPFCIWATVALLAWLFSPPLTVAFFGALGLRAYWRAWRAGLRKSDCYLGDPRLVMLYLATLTLVAVAWAVWQVLG